jgi:hypothetical protein
VGFKTAAQAADAARYFQRTFMDTSRLDCTVRRLLLRVLSSRRRVARFPPRCSA